MQCEYVDCDRSEPEHDLFEASGAPGLHWVCAEHAEQVDNFTGHCSADCCLGYGCDLTC